MTSRESNGIESIDPTIDVTNVRYIDPSNEILQRTLQLERLTARMAHWDRQFGPWVLAVLAAVQLAALVANAALIYKLLRTARTWNRTNLLASLWSLGSVVALSETLWRTLASFWLNGGLYDGAEDLQHLTEMVAAMGRVYGALLAIGWLYSKCTGDGSLLEELGQVVNAVIAVPLCLVVAYSIYYCRVSEYIFEVYGPASDVVNAVVYGLVGLGYASFRIFGGRVQSSATGRYAGQVALVNLVTNLPVSLCTIYLRFVLGLGWTFTLRIYFVEFAMQILNSSGALVALFLAYGYLERYKKMLAKKRHLEEIASSTREPEVQPLRLFISPARAIVKPKTVLEV